MIQSVNTKALDSVLAPDIELNQANLLEDGAEFSHELMASMLPGETDLKVMPVEVSPQNMMGPPSQLIKLPQQGQGEGSDPKVFDPSLTNGVNQIVWPKSTVMPAEMPTAMPLAMPIEITNEQALNVTQSDLGPDANPMENELSQVVLKTPQVHSSKTQFAHPEVDTQLMSMEDFISQKNLLSKKTLSSDGAYGLTSKSQLSRPGLENGLKSTQSIGEVGAQEFSTNGQSMNSQQFILGTQADFGSSLKGSEVSAPVKTFDMSHIKSENTQQIINQITDYVTQAKAAQGPSVNMRVNHEELGIIDITVHKATHNQDAIAVNIAAHSQDGKNFFQENSKDLFSHLTKSGLNISDLKVETPSNVAKNDFDFGGQSGRGETSHGQQFGSEQNQKRHESNRRHDLWNLLKDKEAA